MTDINPGQLGEALNWKADRDLKNLDNTGTGFIIQTGTVIIWPGTTVPDGYLLCDGSAISRTTYAALFAVIGTTYGPGDSSGTFNLPNGEILYGNDFPVIGNGKSVAWTDGINEYGTGTGYNPGGVSLFGPSPNALNANVGMTGTNTVTKANIAFGITTNIQNTGIKVYKNTLKCYIKY